MPSGDLFRWNAGKKSILEGAKMTRNKILHLVGADCGSNDRAQFDRWYNDHIFQLMKFPGLQAATRYKRIFPHATIPEYLCLYEFDTLEDFNAYDGSEAFRDAESDRVAGWGKDGVIPRLRVQFERIGRWSR
jgi:hypothetical protein